MADITINGGTIFAEGTSVGAYPRNRWGVEGVIGAPTGSAVSSGTITGGTVTFTGLSDSTEYIAYASSPNRYKHFSTPPPSTDSGQVVTAVGPLTSASSAVTTLQPGETLYELNSDGDVVAEWVKTSV